MNSFKPFILNNYNFCKIYYFIFWNNYNFCKIYYFIFWNKYNFCKIYYFYVAQIRGGFINWDLDYLRKWVVGEKLRCAPVDFIKNRAYKLDVFF